MKSSATFTAETAERAILDASDGLFYERGIARVGMSDIRDAAGVSLRRLYLLYPSKRELVAAWLADRHQRWMRWFTESVDRRIAAGGDPVLSTFDAIEEWATSPGYRGCAFLNAIAETTEIDDTHRAIVSDHKRALVGYLATLTARAHPAAPRPWLPTALGVLIDGAIVQSAVFKCVSPITGARIAASHLMESL